MSFLECMYFFNLTVARLDIYHAMAQGEKLTFLVADSISLAGKSSTMSVGNSSFFA